jgi:GT2 family glycosyltransferase
MGDDVYLEEDCIDNLMDSWNSLDSENIGAIAPRLIYMYDLQGSKKNNEGTSYMNINPLTGNVRGSSNYSVDKIIKVETTHGFSLISKMAFEAVNGFDEKSFTGNFYREETDLYLRMREKGFNIYYNPKAKIRVQKGKIKGGQWTNVGSSHLMNEIFIFKNHYAFLNKHFGNKKYYMLLFFFFERIFEWINVIIYR